MDNHHHAHALLPREGANQLHGFQLIANVQIAGGFVQQQHLRLLNQRPGEKNALPFAAAELVQAAKGVFLQAEPLNRAEHDFAILLRRPDADVRRAAEHDGFDDAHIQTAAHVLRHIAKQPADLAPRHPVHIRAVERNAARSRAMNAVDALQKGGFARAVGAHDGQHFSLGEGKADVLKHRRLLLIAEGELLSLKHSALAPSSG